VNCVFGKLRIEFFVNGFLSFVCVLLLLLCLYNTRFLFTDSMYKTQNKKRETRTRNKSKEHMGGRPPSAPPVFSHWFESRGCIFNTIFSIRNLVYFCHACFCLAEAASGSTPEEENIILIN